jgi:hypothetical protein
VHRIIKAGSCTNDGSQLLKKKVIYLQLLQLDPGTARLHSLALILSYQEGKQRRDDGLYIHPVSPLSQLHTYIVIMGDV